MIKVRDKASMLSDHLLSFAENRRERYTVERIDRMKLYSILNFFSFW